MAVLFDDVIETNHEVRMSWKRLKLSCPQQPQFACRGEKLVDDGTARTIDAIRVSAEERFRPSVARAKRGECAPTRCKMRHPRCPGHHNLFNQRRVRHQIGTGVSDNDHY
jgi:hypothetical protein